MRSLKLAVAILLLISIVIVGPAQAVKPIFANEAAHPKDPIISYDANWLIGEELFSHVFGEFDMEFTPTEPGDKAEQERLHNYY